MNTPAASSTTATATGAEDAPPPPPSPLPPVLLVCGVSGSGKTTIGTLLASRLGYEYAEADSFHPAANVAKMAAGHPLTDADRAPWLAAIGAFIDKTTSAATPAVVTCSALKRTYRDQLRSARPNVRLIFLDVAPDVVTERLHSRHGHFFPADLLASQYRDLESPASDEHVLHIAVTSPATTPDEVVTQILTALHP
jgi:gluconokinase